MINFVLRTAHPITGKAEEAEWICGFWGPHKYGVRFPSQPGIVYNPVGMDALYLEPPADSLIFTGAAKPQKETT